MNNRKLCPVMLLIGVAVGTGVGILISKPKIDEQKKEIDQLVIQMKRSNTESDENIQKKDKELARMKDMVMQVTAQLSTVKAELQTIKSRPPEPLLISPETSEPEVVITTAGDADRIPSTVPTTDYIIEDGDSFWKIAQEKLGDGNRYTEILELNPKISEDQTLIIGTKIKIPAQ
ncbi:MAG: LysM peptidoglycan-binding domain-containing protein [Planctomycetota bacterium]